MILLLDIGNTHTHLGLANSQRVMRARDITTASVLDGSAAEELTKFIGRNRVTGACLCSVVPKATPEAKKLLNVPTIELTPQTLLGVGINYPNPESIGPDRLANAVAVKHYYGTPAVVVGFGTAVAFDVVDKKGDYVGGIIAPGLSAMTDYLHEKTALLPRIKIRDVHGAIGKSTEQAMLIGAVHGYRGLVKELISQLRRELKVRRLTVVATGGYAKLIASGLPEIDAVEPSLTLEGLRLVWLANKLES